MIKKILDLLAILHITPSGSVEHITATDELNKLKGQHLTPVENGPLSALMMYINEAKENEPYEGKTAEQWYGLHEIMRADFARMVEERDNVVKGVGVLIAERDELLAELEALKKAAPAKESITPKSERIPDGTEVDPKSIPPQPSGAPVASAVGPAVGMPPATEPKQTQAQQPEQ